MITEGSSKFLTNWCDDRAAHGCSYNLRLFFKQLNPIPPSFTEMMWSDAELNWMIQEDPKKLEAWCKSSDFDANRLLLEAIELRRTDIIHRVARSITGPDEININLAAHYAVLSGDLITCKTLRLLEYITINEFLCEAVVQDKPEMIELAREWGADDYASVIDAIIFDSASLTEAHQIQQLRLVMSWGGQLTELSLRLVVCGAEHHLDLLRFVWRNIPLTRNHKFEICCSIKLKNVVESFVMRLFIFDAYPRRFGWMWLAAFSLVIDGYCAMVTPETQRAATIVGQSWHCVAQI
jgi:hypothetical protein